MRTVAYGAISDKTNMRICEDLLMMNVIKDDDGICHKFVRSLKLRIEDLTGREE